MTAIQCTTYIDMGDGDVVEMEDARGSTLAVSRGRAWLTQHRDPRDIVLAAGETWTIEKDGLTVVQADGDAALRVVGPGGAAARVRPATATPSRWDRLHAWLVAFGESGLGSRRVPYF